MSEETEIKLNDITFLALDHAVDSIKSSLGPLIPFAILEDDKGERNLKRYATEMLEEGLERAKADVTQNKLNMVRYAIAWDGFVTIEDKKTDAVIVESGDNSGKGLLICQRYQKVGLIKKRIETIGNPALFGDPISRISGSP